VDGCEKRCAARGTEMYSGKPAAEIVVTDLTGDQDLGSGRRLSEAGDEAVEAVAAEIAGTVDDLLGVKWDRRRGEAADGAEGVAVAGEEEDAEAKAKVATCACGSGIPIQKVMVNGHEVTFIALPLIFERFREQGKGPMDSAAEELMEMVRIYTPVPEGEEEAYEEAVMRAYAAFWKEGS